MNATQRVASTLAAASLLAAAFAVPAPAADSAAAVSALRVRPDLYMLTVNGLNVALQTGPQGAVLVDSGPADASAAVLEQIKQLTKQPLRFVIETSADPELIGGSAALSGAGQSLMIGWVLLRQYNNEPDSITGHLLDTRAPIIARQKILERVVAQPDGYGPANLALPSETFTRPQYNLRVNGQGIEVVSMPPAHSDSDSVVLFRGSDVVVTGAIFDVTRFPVIDLQHGGSLQGEIDAINQVMNTLVIAAVPIVDDSGGTQIIPLHGPVCDQSDLLVYRDMLSAVRDRIQSLIDQGKSLAQVRAANPAQGYETRFGSDSGSWTTRDFIDAAYRSVMAQKQARGRGRQD